ncbi:MCE family protein [Pseudonocardia parietis]|uniref:Phospholipid/cholesterol/gamma-HCH transport system substrate-binding protein n=1 Tax=Pseudonocardia parietis TaxID=570936 RepID=A0ABS4VLK8_9PSEU|nr:MlaD family protein [Pseudonocardia parietis]MBP2364804.1 phospholipid/cholesterol/gamma-HCH transport system substrate-binding protein [Pseudonocardia parietis]
MILTRFIRIQLTVLVITALIGAVVLGSVYLRVPALLGVGKYQVTAEFTDAARLYERAEVTYRGRPIGQVTGVALGDGRGVRVDMQLDSGIDIPATVRAEARSMSAVGEQYVDLTAGPADGSRLEPGAVIPMDRTTVPLQIGPVLDQVNSLVEALPEEDLRTVVDETYDAFRGTGQPLQEIIDGGRTLVDAAARDFEPTARLLDQLGPLLDTQTEIDPELRSLSRDLAVVTDRLRASDGDIRGLLAATPAYTEEVVGLLTDIRPTVPVLLGNLTSVGEVLEVYNPNLRQLLVVYPLVASLGQSASLANGDEARLNVDLDLAVNAPPHCVEGFVPADRWRDPADTSPAEPIDAYCRLPADDPTGVRGARNTPCAEFPGRRAASPEDCRGGGSPVTAPGNPPFPPGSPAGDLLGGDAHGDDPEQVSAVPYDPVTGRVVGPDGTPFYLADVANPHTSMKGRTWQSLLLWTIDR